MPETDIPLVAVLGHCEALPVETFAPGAALLAEGPHTGKMFILKSGEVEVMRGETRVADIAEPGAIFGEIAALLGGPHTATVRAVTEVKAHRIDDAEAVMRDNHEIALHIARILARRLVEATGYLADIKNQYGHRDDHFGMLDEVLDALVQRQGPSVAAGSERESDPRL